MYYYININKFNIMRIQYISDIHLEFYKNKFPNIIPMAPILCLAGDIGHPNSINYISFLQELNNKREFEKIFLITGNHEYYKQCISIDETNNKIKSLINDYNLYKISFLNNSCEYYNGYKFIGSTLWSHIYNKNNLTNDFCNIKDMTITNYNSLHVDSTLYLKKEIENTNNKIVVISHFLPSYRLIQKKYVMYSRYNQCYASHCDYLIKDPIVLWIYGHTHSKYKTKIKDINMVCNPLGYNYNNKIINYNEFIDV